MMLYINYQKVYTTALAVSIFDLIYDQKSINEFNTISIISLSLSLLIGKYFYACLGTTIFPRLLTIKKK